jgi:hypothetical protein
VRHLVAIVSALVGASVGLPPATTYAGVSRTVIPLSEGFETGLRTFINAGGGCAPVCLWGVVTSHANTGIYAVYADDPPQATEQILQPVTSVAIPSNATSATLSFWHLYDFESDNVFNYDGGVLEVSTDDGTTWSDAGANIIAGGYTGTISATGLGNPLAGRAGWIFTSPAGWAQVVVDILPYRGQSLKFRWGLGSDNRNIGLPGGWWIDDVQVSYDAPSACRALWGQESPYPIATYLTAAVSLKGSLYVFGGHSMSTTAIANAYRYVPDTNQWTPIASLPEPRYGASAVTDGRYIYILGGTPDSIVVEPTLWRYDPEADSYATLTPFGTATAEQAAAYLDGVIYRIGGKIDLEDRLNTNTVEAYTIATDSWTAVAPHPLRGYGSGALTLGGYVYTAGGRSAVGASAHTYRRRRRAARRPAALLRSQLRGANGHCIADRHAVSPTFGHAIARGNRVATRPGDPHQDVDASARVRRRVRERGDGDDRGPRQGRRHRAQRTAARCVPVLRRESGRHRRGERVDRGGEQCAERLPRVLRRRGARGSAPHHHPHTVHAHPHWPLLPPLPRQIMAEVRASASA